LQRTAGPYIRVINYPADNQPVGSKTSDSGHEGGQSARLKRASNGLMCRNKKTESFDNLVVSHKQRWRNRKPKRFRGLEVDDH
jgi:hypothetical protein